MNKGVGQCGQMGGAVWTNGWGNVDKWVGQCGQMGGAVWTNGWGSVDQRPEYCHYKQGRLTF